MAYRVELTERAIRDLNRLYEDIKAGGSAQARDWFDGLKRAIFSRAKHPVRTVAIPEDNALRHLLYGRKRNIYRIIVAIDKEIVSFPYCTPATVPTRLMARMPEYYSHGQLVTFASLRL